MPDIYEVLRLNGKLATIFAGAFPPNPELVTCLPARQASGWPQEGRTAEWLMFGYSYKK
jgi:hypothetical protein